LAIIFCVRWISLAPERAEFTSSTPLKRGDFVVPHRSLSYNFFCIQQTLSTFTNWFARGAYANLKVGYYFFRAVDFSCAGTR
jgi:hypothetical protein